MQRALGAMRAYVQHLRAGRGLDGGHGRRMVAMRMGDEDVRHGLTAHGIEQRRDVLWIVRAGIDDRDLATPDDVADRSLEGERSWIVSDDAAHARRNVFG